MENNSLNGKNVLITGGNKGIGFAISQKLIECGAYVFSLSRSITNVDENDNSKYKQISCDITNYEELESTLNNLKSNIGNIEILINNAGIIKFGPFATSEISDAHKIISTNLVSAINLTHLILPDMLSSKFGLILNISSVGVLYNYPNCSVYNASKAGLLSFSRSLRNEVRRQGIKIIDILPGATNTEIWDDKSRDKFSSKMMTPDDVALSVVEVIIQSLNDRLMIEEITITPQMGSL